MSLPFNTGSIAKQISVKSAVNPSLWACAVISLPLFILCTRVDGFLLIVLLIVAVLPVVAFILSYLFLLFKNPKYLRSEEFHLRAEILELLGDRDNPFNANADDVVSVITNPRLTSSTNPQPEDLEQLPSPDNNTENE